MLEIQNLKASIEQGEILKGINLKASAGEVHAIMGPNGSGKSTLAKVIGGHPGYEVTDGDVSFQGKSIMEMEPDERAREGIFISFQYPVEVPGVNNAEFLRMAYNTRLKDAGKEEVDPLEFDE